MTQYQTQKVTAEWIGDGEGRFIAFRCHDYLPGHVWSEGTARAALAALKALLEPETT